jgi:hypothetical protein
VGGEGGSLAEQPIESAPSPAMREMIRTGLNLIKVVSDYDVTLSRTLFYTGGAASRQGFLF